MIEQGHIRIENVYYMLAYAFRALSDEKEYDRVRTESFENAEDLFGEILSLGMSGLVKRGLHRAYVEANEDMAGLRGKIEMTATMRHKISGRNMLNFTHDDFSADNDFNRILKTTAVWLLRTGRLHKSGDRLKRVLMSFGEIGELDAQHIRWGALRYQRNNAHYVMLMNICRFVIDGLIMGDDVNAGDRKIRHIRYDEEKLCNLYEAFIREYYARHFNLCARAAWIDWAIDEGDDSSQLPQMKTDIMLSRGDKKLIIDAKFYNRSMQEHMGKYSVHSHNLYQILAYVNNARANEPIFDIAGMLLYAKTDDSRQPDLNVTIAGMPICVQTLDLSCKFEQIAAQLNAIAEKYFGMLPHD